MMTATLNDVNSPKKTSERSAEEVAAAELVKPGMQFSGFAPSVFELAEACGRFDIFSRLCRERDDLVGYATGLLVAAEVGK